jgi:periplasmic protein TonB
MTVMKDINILQANILDIIFEGKNKEYGAYELRTNYQKRLAMSVIGMIAGCGILLLLYSFAMRPNANDTLPDIDTGYKLVEVPKDDEPEKPVEIEKPKPVPPVAMEKFVTPLITTEEIKPEDEVPEMEDLQDVKIGPVDQAGDKDNGIVAPPVEGVKDGIIEAPKKDEDEGDGIVLTVQIEAQYPGGMSAWQRYLNRTFKYPEEAVENLIAGAVVVQFVVDKEGNVTDVEAISGPEKGGLREEAVRVIKKSGKWTPAIQNGRQVKSYKKQPIIFQLENE